jgi:PadR family transcriptional regulator, regulatory protein PadR
LVVRRLKMKNSDSYLGEFEELVLLTILKLGRSAYGASILKELENATDRNISVGALYATFDRLERKGFVKSWQEKGTAERGGRTKRYFKVEGTGLQALAEGERVRRRLVPVLDATLATREAR